MTKSGGTQVNVLSKVHRSVLSVNGYDEIIGNYVYEVAAMPDVKYLLLY